MTLYLHFVEMNAIEILKRYEQWEANLILSQEAWDGGLLTLPKLTQELWDELLEIQTLRNEILKKPNQEGSNG